MMERTESEIVQVGPAYENAMIKHMEQWGWNLQSRQEIHEEGDATVGRSVLGDTYVIKTKVSHYVKLHFARSLSLPNLDRIRPLENEYNGLTVDFPTLIPGGIPPVLVFVLVLFGGWALWPFYYYLSYKPRKQQADERLPVINRRRQEITKELTGLLAT